MKDATEKRSVVGTGLDAVSHGMAVLVLLASAATDR